MGVRNTNWMEVGNREMVMGYLVLQECESSEQQGQNREHRLDAEQYRGLAPEDQ